MLASACSPSLPAIIQTELLCKDWQVIRPSAADIKAMSEKTAVEILANNEARTIYGCARLENEAT